MEWQPIETAPKDGTRILMYGIPGFEILIGFWNDYHIPEHWCYSEESLYKNNGNPTHWMPLPPPPG